MYSRSLSNSTDLNKEQEDMYNYNKTLSINNSVNLNKLATSNLNYKVSFGNEDLGK